MTEDELEEVKKCFQLNDTDENKAKLELLENCVDREVVDNIEMSICVNDTATKVGDSTDSSNWNIK